MIPRPPFCVENSGKAERRCIFGGTCSFEKTQRCTRIFKRSFCWKKQRGCGESYLYGSLFHFISYWVHYIVQSWKCYLIPFDDQRKIKSSLSFLVFELTFLELVFMSFFLNPTYFSGSYFKMHEEYYFNSSIHVTDAKDSYLTIYSSQVEALAVKLTQNEGELIQEKFEVKKLVNFLKQVFFDIWFFFFFFFIVLKSLLDFFFIFYFYFFDYFFIFFY